MRYGFSGVLSAGARGMEAAASYVAACPGADGCWLTCLAKVCESPEPAVLRVDGEMPQHGHTWREIGAA